jgi:hypothetical protein
MHTWMAVMVILLLTGVLAADVVAGRGRGDSRHHGPYVQPHPRTHPHGPLFNHDRVPGHPHPHTGTRTPGDPRRSFEEFGTYPKPLHVTPDR